MPPLRLFTCMFKEYRVPVDLENWTFLMRWGWQKVQDTVKFEEKEQIEGLRFVYFAEIEIFLLKVQ